MTCPKEDVTEASATEGVEAAAMVAAETLHEEENLASRLSKDSELLREEVHRSSSLDHVAAKFGTAYQEHLTLQLTRISLTPVSTESPHSNVSPVVAVLDERRGVRAPSEYDAKLERAAEGGTATPPVPTPPPVLDLGREAGDDVVAEAKSEDTSGELPAGGLEASVGSVTLENVGEVAEPRSKAPHSPGPRDAAFFAGMRKKKEEEELRKKQREASKMRAMTEDELQAYIAKKEADLAHSKKRDKVLEVS